MLDLAHYSTVLNPFPFSMLANRTRLLESEIERLQQLLGMLRQIKERASNDERHDEAFLTSVDERIFRCQSELTTLFDQLFDCAHY